MLAFQPVDTLIISTEGPKPSEKEWNQLFARVASRGDAELLKIEFAQVLKPEALMNWIVDSWFPQALIEADAATVRYALFLSNLIYILLWQIF